MSSFIRRILYEAHILLIRRIIQDMGAIFPEKRSWCLFSSRHCIHMNTLFSPEPPPLPRKTILRWQNYVEFREFP